MNVYKQSNHSNVNCEEVIIWVYVSFYQHTQVTQRHLITNLLAFFLIKYFLQYVQWDITVIISMIKYNVIFINQIFNFLLKKNYNPKFLFCNLIKNSVELLQVCYIWMIPCKYRYIFWLYNNHDNKFNNNAPFALVELTSLRTTVAYSILQS